MVLRHDIVQLHQHDRLDVDDGDILHDQLLRGVLVPRLCGRRCVR